MPDRKHVILHVDDDEANRYAVTRSLQVAGFDVLEAADGATALRHMLSRPDLVILDVGLPDIGGFEICRRIKNDPLTAFIPVLHLSASLVTGQDKATGLDGGADGYLIRPVDPLELVATVNALLRAKLSEDALRQSEGENRALVEELKKVVADRENLLRSEHAARIEAERAGRMKDEFLATLSHELRTPLNAILGWASILRQQQSTGEDLREGLDVIERNARAQTQIIEDLLDMSRIVSGKVRLDVQRVDPAAVVESAVDTVKPTAAAKGVRVAVTLDRAAGPITGDANRLQQVCWNLLTNAVKFTPRDGQIDVSLTRVGSHVELTVTDSGQGISAEFLPYVFDRFRQADASTTRRHGGLGLGLSIVRQLVELHGGEVRAASEGAGRGSSFTVSLPLISSGAPARAGDSPGEPQKAATFPAVAPDCVRLDGVRVVVVDDEPDARELLRRLLEDCGARVTVAASAEEAYAAVTRERPDVLLSDIGMPDEDGCSLITRLRALPADQGGDVPALALTAYARSEDRTRSILAGFQMHLSKPVEPAELLAIVASLTRRR